MKKRILELLKNSGISILDYKDIEKYLNELEDDSLFLNALEYNGVDNWEWYDDAVDDYNKWREENER
ncbi:MAG: hypothetical protein ACI4PE_02810 [Bacilli bacterium]